MLVSPFAPALSVVAALAALTHLKWYLPGSFTKHLKKKTFRLHISRGKKTNRAEERARFACCRTCGAGGTVSLPALSSSSRSRGVISSGWAGRGIARYREALRHLYTSDKSDSTNKRKAQCCTASNAPIETLRAQIRPINVDTVLYRTNQHKRFVLRFDQ